MVVIRLTRGGAKGRPFYSVIATDKQNRRDGRFIERLGYYNPMATQAEVGVRIATDRVDHWRGQGAQVSPAVERLIKLQAGKTPAGAAAAA